MVPFASARFIQSHHLLSIPSSASLSRKPIQNAVKPFNVHRTLFTIIHQGHEAWRLSFGRNPIRLKPGIHLNIPVYHSIQVCFHPNQGSRKLTYYTVLETTGRRHEGDVHQYQGPYSFYERQCPRLAFWISFLQSSRFI